MSSTTEPGFAMSTEIAATPEAVYAAWTTKEGVARWLAEESEIDARVGGRYILRWPLPEGGELSARGEYLELVPNRKIVQTWESWGPEGQDPNGNATVTVTIEDLGDGRVRMTQDERGVAYNDPARIEQSRGGTIEAHTFLKAALEG